MKDVVEKEKQWTNLRIVFLWLVRYDQPFALIGCYKIVESSWGDGGEELGGVEWCQGQQRGVKQCEDTDCHNVTPSSMPRSRSSKFTAQHLVMESDYFIVHCLSILHGRLYYIEIFIPKQNHDIFSI